MKKLLYKYRYPRTYTTITTIIILIGTCFFTACGKSPKKQIIIGVPVYVFFGDGPMKDEVMLSLESYLNSLDDVSKPDQNTWLYTNKTTNTTYQVKIGDTEEGLKSALSTSGAYVVFSGHSNYGIGPAFSNKSITRISDFTNFGTDYTGIHWQHLRTNRLDRTIPLEIIDEEIPCTASNSYNPTNYIVPYVNMEKFENNSGIRVGQKFTDLYGLGYDRYHYRDWEGKPYIIVKAGKADLPPYLEYKAFFMASCRSGTHFIENFQHGVFFYTDYPADALHKSATFFVEAFLSGKSNDEIIGNINYNEWRSGKVQYEIFD